MVRIGFLFILYFFCCSCTAPSRLETALRQSGANRSELEKVLAHYEGDSLKYRAACFLIEHMPGKYSLEPERTEDPYRNFLRHIPSTDSINWKLDSCHVGHLLDSVAMGRKYPYYGEDLSRPYDSNNIRVGDMY